MAQRRFSYLWYGFHIESDISLGEPADAAAPCAAVGDLRIEVAATTVAELAPTTSGYALLDPDTISLHVPGVAAFLIERGEAVRVFQHPETRPEQIRAYLLGSVIAAAMHQRGIVPLHASSVRTPRGVAAFSAPRGFGKSTIAAGLWQRGYEMLSDDILALKESGAGQVACLRGAPALKLLPDAVAKLQIGGVLPNDKNDVTGKYHLPVEPMSRADALPLWRVYYLQEGPHLRIRRLPGAESMACAVSNIYRPELIGLLNAQRRLLPQMASIVSTAASFVIERPPMSNLDEVLNALDAHISEGCQGSELGIARSA